MKINELKVGIGNVTVSGEIVAKEEPREVVSKFGKRLKVASATLRDETGDITLSLWNEDVDKYAVGDKVEVQDGWVSEFKGTVQLSAGRGGRIVKL